MAGLLGLDPEQSVLRLVDKSMLQAKPGTDGVMRYRMLETLREFSAARLAETARPGDALRHHAELFGALAERQAPVLRSGEQGRAIRLLEREDGNLRAAFDWCCRTGEHDLALRLVGASAGTCGCGATAPSAGPMSHERSTSSRPGRTR